MKKPVLCVFLCFFDHLDSAYLMQATYNRIQENGLKFELKTDISMQVNTTETQTNTANIGLMMNEKQHILDELNQSVLKMQQQINFRTNQLRHLEDRLQQFERVQAQVQILAQKEREVESQYEDYCALNSKLEKQLRMMHEEAQILKGKTVIDYNKLGDIREESASQDRQKEVLQKHHEQLKKGVQNLKKKINHLKQQHKKKAFSRHKVEQVDIQKQINNLRIEIQSRKEEISDKQTNKDKYLTEQRYRQLLKQLQQLKKYNAGLSESQQINQKLLQERNELQTRIKFLKGVDIQFINQKKLMLSQLKEKHALLEKQLNSNLQDLQVKMSQLAELEANHPEGLVNMKKMGRKRRQLKVKTPKKSKEVAQQAEIKQAEQKTYRFKGHKLKRMGLIIAGVLLIFGLVLNNTIWYSI